MEKIPKIKPHETGFKFAKDANKYLQLADAFLEAHPELIFWTERNATKKGLFYMYKNGLYSVVSTLEVEEMLVNFKPKDTHIVIPSFLSESKINETMKNIMRRRFFYRDKFNPHGIINLKNGFFKIDEMELYPHTMDIISTTQLPYEYDKNATCPTFMKILYESTENDISKMAIIQQFAGYCLIRETRFNRILYLVGASNSGKSTILEGIISMLGEENVSCVSLEKLCQPRYAGNFIDKIANIATEIPRDISGYEDALKTIVTGEKITVDTKFVPTYDARPFCKLIFAGNDLPIITDSSDGIFNRMLLIYFNNVVSKEKIDTTLKDKIRTEGAGIMNWALEGLNILLKNGKFFEPEQMVKDINDLKIQNNSVYYFISENYEVGLPENEYIIYDEIYEKYKDFCHKVGAKGIFKKVVFGKELKKIFPKELVYGQKSINGITKKVWFKMGEKKHINTTPEMDWKD